MRIKASNPLIVGSKDQPKYISGEVFMYIKASLSVLSHEGERRYDRREGGSL